MDKNKKFIVVGLDGATFDVMTPLMEKGCMPCLKRLREEGVSAVLRSTSPPITGPAWMSLLTGLSPENTGVYDFFYRDGDSLSLKPISSRDFRRNNALCDYLSGKGKSVCLYNYPMLYPAYELNGAMVSGIGSPPDRTGFYPEQLFDELDSISGGHEIALPYNDQVYRDDDEKFFRDLNLLFEKNSREIRHLLEKKDWDLFFCVLSVTDFMQHYAWKYWKEIKADDLSGSGMGFGQKEFVKFWQKVDAFLGELTEKFGDRDLIVVSDHGFGHQRYKFYMNSWLRSAGFLKLKRAVRMRNAVKRSLKRIVSSVMPGHLVKKLLSLRIDQRAKTIEPYAIVDLRRSEAVALEHNVHFSGIYVLDRKNRKDVLDRIEQGLRSLFREKGIDIETARPRVLRKDVSAPDMIVNFKDYTGAIIPNNFDNRIIEEGPFQNLNGMHRDNGIFVARGDRFRKGLFFRDGIRIVDIYPLLSGLIAGTVPSGLDGRFVTGILEESSAGIPGAIREEHVVASGEARDPERQDAEKVKERLRDLGYL